jgi:class 3 adenylate cyclase
MEREIRYCTTEDGVRIAYCLEGEGPILVMCPLFIESFSLDHLLPEQGELARGLGTLSIVKFDWRGTGLSERGSPVIGFLESQIIDLEAVVTATGAESVSLWANGNSGPPALRFVRQYPDRVSSLVLMDTCANILDAVPADTMRGFADLARTNWPLLAQIFGDMSTRQEAPEAGLRWGQVYFQSTTGEFLASILSKDRIEQVARDRLERTDLHTINTRAIVLHRRNDSIFAFELGHDLAAALPNASFVPLDGVIAAAAFGDSESVLRAVVPFLSKGRSRREPKPGPAAFRTILFTDLVGHTEMMSRLGDERGRDVLREHERITREVLKAHGGTEVKTMGDGFMASFGSVTKAVECAVALQRAFANREGEPLSVRVGLNAGEPIEEDGDLFGATVILASRIAAKAEGGEILVADTVRGLCSGKGFLFADRGEFVAKGIEEPVRVYEVSWRS